MVSIPHVVFSLSFGRGSLLTLYRPDMNMRPGDEAQIIEEEAGDNIVEPLSWSVSPESSLLKLPKIVRKTMKSLDLNSPPGWSVTQRKSAVYSTFTCW